VPIQSKQPTAKGPAEWFTGDVWIDAIARGEEPSRVRVSAVRFTPSAGITLIQLAIGFVLNHPAITAALIGPRTMEQLDSQLPAADVVLDEALLDRIDEIVPPGTTINPVDDSFDNPALQPVGCRR
jgi:aryl-alcohol dehydrogenase-like predicted oxidoreductase